MCRRDPFIREPRKTGRNTRFSVEDNARALAAVGCLSLALAALVLYLGCARLRKVCRKHLAQARAEARAETLAETRDGGNRASAAGAVPRTPPHWTTSLGDRGDPPPPSYAASSPRRHERARRLSDSLSLAASSGRERLVSGAATANVIGTRLRHALAAVAAPELVGRRSRSLRQAPGGVEARIVFSDLLARSEDENGHASEADESVARSSRGRPLRLATIAEEARNVEEAAPLLDRIDSLPPPLSAAQK